MAASGRPADAVTAWRPGARDRPAAGMASADMTGPGTVAGRKRLSSPPGRRQAQQPAWAAQKNRVMRQPGTRRTLACGGAGQGLYSRRIAAVGARALPRGAIDGTLKCHPPGCYDGSHLRVPGGPQHRVHRRIGDHGDRYRAVQRRGQPGHALRQVEARGRAGGGYAPRDTVPVAWAGGERSGAPVN